MAPMRAEMTGRERWIFVDGNVGGTWIPTDVATLPRCPSLVSPNGWPVGEDITEDWILRQIEELCPSSGPARAAHYWGGILDKVSDYYEGVREAVWSVKLVDGFGVRSSAPGYMDQTEWSVYESEEEAREAFQEEREGTGEADEDEDSDAEPEAVRYIPGAHPITDDPTEAGLCAAVADDPRGGPLLALADWRIENGFPEFAPGSAAEFFAWMSGVVDPAVRVARALDLAESERWGRQQVAEGEMRVSWVEDSEGDASYPDDGPHEACIIYRRNPQFDELTGGDEGFRVYPNAPEWIVSESLWAIDRPDANYRRFIEAELFGEVRAEMAKEPPDLIAATPADESP